MLVTPSGITRLVKEVQPQNALSPMLVTLLGITRLVKDLQPLNAQYPILFTPSGMTYDVVSLSLNAIILLLSLSNNTLLS